MSYKKSKMSLNVLQFESQKSCRHHAWNYPFLDLGRPKHVEFEIGSLLVSKVGEVWMEFEKIGQIMAIYGKLKQPLEFHHFRISR